MNDSTVSGRKESTVHTLEKHFPPHSFCLSKEVFLFKFITIKKENVGNADKIKDTSQSLKKVI